MAFSPKVALGRGLWPAGQMKGLPAHLALLDQLHEDGYTTLQLATVGVPTPLSRSRLLTRQVAAGLRLRRDVDVVQPLVPLLRARGIQLQRCQP